MSSNQPGDQEPLDAEIVADTPAGLPQPVALPEPDYSEGGVPSFDSVRDRIEKRYETSVGAQEIAGLGGK